MTNVHLLCYVGVYKFGSPGFCENDKRRKCESQLTAGQSFYVNRISGERPFQSDHLTHLHPLGKLIYI